jgi:hypothetical protein
MSIKTKKEKYIFKNTFTYFGVNSSLETERERERERKRECVSHHKHMFANKWPYS